MKILWKGSQHLIQGDWEKPGGRRLNLTKASTWVGSQRLTTRLLDVALRETLKERNKPVLVSHESSGADCRGTSCKPINVRRKRRPPTFLHSMWPAFVSCFIEEHYRCPSFGLRPCTQTYENMTNGADGE